MLIHTKYLLSPFHLSSINVSVPFIMKSADYLIVNPVSRIRKMPKNGILFFMNDPGKQLPLHLFDCKVMK